MFLVPWLVGCCLRLRNPISLRNRVSLYLTLLEKSYNAFWVILEAEPPDVRSQPEAGNEINEIDLNSEIPIFPAPTAGHL
jgi:hypothetical protein